MSASLPYRFAFGAATLVAAVTVSFFFIGIADGSVSAFNIGLWIGLLVGIGAVLFAAHHLHARGYSKIAIALLAVPALPGLLYALFLAVALLSGARWN